jgi:hypothetical protein
MDTVCVFCAVLNAIDTCIMRILRDVNLLHYISLGSKKLK